MPAAPATKSTLSGLRPSLSLLAGFALAGFVLILYVHHFSLSPSVLILTAAWLGILGSGYYLWIAGLMVAAGDQESEGFHLARNRTEELLAEKQALLKAIKEVEFDHLMKKLSDEDAAALSQFYRRRAVEILKELDSDPGADETLSIAERIERDIRAQAKVGSVAERARKRAAAKAGKSRAPKKSKFVAETAAAEGAASAAPSDRSEEEE